MNFAMVRKSFLAFDKVSELDQMGILYQTESFLTACMSLVHKLDKPWSRQWPSFTNTRKELIEMCSPIGHNSTKHFFVPNQEPAPLEFLEMVRWQSVPRGSFARNENFRPAFSPDPNDCPWVSEDAGRQNKPFYEQNLSKPSRMTTAITFSRQNDAGSRASAT